MTQIGRRLDRLEAELIPPQKPSYVFWWKGKQTREEAIAATFPEGIDPEGDIVFVTWRASSEAGADDGQH